MDLDEFGYLPDPEKKLGEKPDWSFQSDMVPKLQNVLSGDVDFRGHCTDTHQRSIPACVGNASADAVEVLSSLQGYPKVELSRMFVWTLARNYMDRDRDNRGDYDKKTGTYLRLAFDVLSHFGICLEEHWPYDVSKWNRLPSLSAMRKATRRKVKEYYRITETGSDRPDAVLTALRAEHPVTFGTDIDEAFMTYDGRGSVGIPTGKIVGGHAMLCVGYDSQRGFIVKNSWGSSWGDGGYAYFTPEYMGWKKTWDLWVPTLGKNFNV